MIHCKQDALSAVTHIKGTVRGLDPILCEVFTSSQFVLSPRSFSLPPSIILFRTSCTHPPRSAYGNVIEGRTSTGIDGEDWITRGAFNTSHDNKGSGCIRVYMCQARVVDRGEDNM